MKTLKNRTLAGQHPDRIELKVDEQHSFCLYVLEPQLCHALIKQHHALRLDSSWSIAPDQDVPWQGRDRLSTQGCSQPGYRLADAAL